MKNSKELVNADIDLSAFTFSADDFTVNDAEFLKNTSKKLQKILDREFANDSEKRRIVPRDRGSGDKRLNFACPYCRDSAKNSTKKRGNIYIPGYNFHCYNCRTHTSLEDFMTDFNGELSPEERVHLFNMREDSSNDYKEVKYLDFGYFINFEKLDQFAIDREVLMQALDLFEITEKESFGIKKYLLGRFQKDFEKFAYDKNKHRLIIFNRLPNKRILGFQVRNFKSEPKYITYTLSMIYDILKKKYEKGDEEFQEADRLSFLFGLESTDFAKPITVFEGPLDSFLFDNGMSVCGVDNDFPLDIPVRWIYDYDREGMRKALERLDNGETVFMWKKYIEDHKIYNNFNKLDLTDFKEYIKKKNKKELETDGYFTNDKFDAIFI